MLYYFLLLLIPVANCVQNISQKSYNRKVHPQNVIAFSTVTAFMALIFFLVTSGFRLSFDVRVVPYSIFFGISFALAWVGSVEAIRCGSLAISNLIVSSSLVFPTGYGLVMGEPLTGNVIAGVLLLFTALVMINLKTENGKRFSLRWLAFISLSFFANGVCSISQNAQKQALGEEYSHEFMIIALALSILLLMIYGFITSKAFLKDLRKCFLYSAANGTANGALNLLIIIIIGNIPNTIMYPSMAALNMIAVFLLAFFVYKERFSRMQYIGYVLGTLSIILLNL